jgi:bifunctional enzyme CysN/CysC
MPAERVLIESGCAACVLDGDNLRHGLNGNLGFSADASTGNVRRTADAAALLADTGVVAAVSPVWPCAADRVAARKVAENHGFEFVEVFVDTPLERRDRDGSHAKARAGKMAGFTGADAPYETPERAQVVPRHGELSVEEATARLLEVL